MTTTTITSTFIPVHADELAAVAKWCHPTENHYMNMVVFRGGEYVACDGNRLVRVPCRTFAHVFGIAPLMISVALAAHRMAAAAPQVLLEPVYSTVSPDIVREVRFHFAVSGPKPTVQGDLRVTNDIHVTVPTSSTRLYPAQEAIDRVMRTLLPATPAALTFDPAFWSAIAEIHGATSGDHEDVTIESWTTTKPVTILARNKRGVRFLVMPT